MARVSLRTVVINDRDDPSDFVALVAASRLSHTSKTATSPRVTASGRIDLVVAGPAVRSWRLDCDGVTVEELAWLRSHEARVCCFRDPLGNKMFGFWDETTDAPLWSSGWAALSLSISEVTVSEVVA